MKRNKWIRSILKKAFVFIVSLFVLCTLVFYVSRLAPGDPLIAYYGDRVERMSTEERHRAEEHLGLHDAITVQYVKWLKQVADGDFGISYKYKMPAQEVIESRAGNSSGWRWCLFFFLPWSSGCCQALELMLSAVGTTLATGWFTSYCP